jgi:tetratricopeptide (TPR) repeat protein
MERRFAVHAGGNTQALTRRRARPRPWVIALVLVSVAGVAAAKPKRRDAKAAFDRGLAAYQKGNFEDASEALGKSFDLERDVDTLFAWAQAERKLEHCDKAIGLYERLLGFNLPPANRDAVELKRTECLTIVAQQKPKVEPPPAPPKVEPAPGEPKVEPPPGEPPRAADHPAVAPAPRPDTGGSAGRAWYKDPVAIALVGTGAVATGVGAGLLISARSLDSQAKDSKNYFKVMDLSDQAQSRGTLGLITASVGGALVVGGVVWIVTHRGATEQHALTGWLAPGGGGLAVAGAF